MMVRYPQTFHEAIVRVLCAVGISWYLRCNAFGPSLDLSVHCLLNCLVSFPLWHSTIMATESLIWCESPHEPHVIWRSFSDRSEVGT
jgi:hypothetical protein